MSADMRGLAIRTEWVRPFMFVLAGVLGVLVALQPLVALATLPVLAGTAFLLRVPYYNLLLLTLSVFVPPATLGGFGLGLDDLLPLLAVGSGAVYLLQRWRQGVRRNPYVLPFLLMMGSGIVATLVNAEGMQEILEIGLKGVVRHGVSFSIVVLAYSLTDTRSRWQRLIKSLIAVSVAEAGFGILAYVLNYRGPFGIGLVDPATYLRIHGTVKGRVVGTLSTPGAGGGSNFLGGYLALMVPVTIGVALASRTQRGRMLGTTAVGMQVVCLALTYTRASMVCLILGLVVMLAVRGRWWAVVKFAPVLLAAVGLLIVWVPGLRYRIDVDIRERTIVWATAARLLMAVPVTGIGPGRYLELLRSPPVWLWRALGTAFPELNPHNTFLFYGVEQGLAALIAMFWLAILCLSQGWKAWKQARSRGDRGTELISLGLASGLTAFLCNNLFASLIHLPSLGVYFWLMCGLVWRLSSTAAEGEKIVV